MSFRDNTVFRLITTTKMLVVILLLFSSLDAQSQSYHRYTSISDRIDYQKFPLSNNRSFDERGILTQKDQYHPLAIAQYGIMAFDYYQETGDSEALKSLRNQVQFFLDSTLVDNLFDGKGIGLPYRFDWIDLDATWYSGMTQGVAISFLLRYHSITQDENILPVIEKIAFLLKVKEEHGGTLGQTPHGDWWIEEYPNSLSDQQVMNGGINGLIGLHEYCLYFAEDTVAANIRDKCYQGLLQSLPQYDLPNWTKYSYDGRPIANNYLRYQVFEMLHLFQIFGEDRFLKQMMIWSTFLQDTHNTLEYDYYKYQKHYQPSLSVELFNDGKLYPIIRGEELFTLDSITVFNKEEPLKFNSANKSYSIELAGKNKVFSIESTDTMAVNAITLGLAQVPKDLQINLVYVTNDGKKKNAGEPTMQSQFQLKWLLPERTSIHHYKFVVKSKPPVFIELNWVSGKNSAAFKNPFFTHYSHFYFAPAQQKVRFDFGDTSPEGLYIFYRQSDSKKGLQYVNWSFKKMVPSSGKNIVLFAGHYEFKVVRFFSGYDAGHYPLNVVPIEE